MKHHSQMRFDGNLSDVPRLRTTGSKDRLLSKNWTARGRVQRVGAILFAALFLLASVAAFVGGVILRVQVLNAVNGILGQALGIAVELAPFLMACGLIFAAVRLIQGVRRSFHK
jgi:hypothetical protein